MVFFGIWAAEARAVTPTITSISPSSAPAGSPGFSLTVRGSNFNSRTVALWNGNPRPTTVVSSTELRAAISAADLAKARHAAVRVMDSSVGKWSSPKYFTVTSGGGTTALAISTSSLPSGGVGTAYSASFAATGGTAPYVWSVVSGSLPSGLTFANTGKITGTPTVAGTFNFSVQAKDSASTPQAATSAFSITISPIALRVTTSALSNATVNTAYKTALAASGGTAPYTWSLYSGTLPAGITLTSAGVLSGTPTSASSYSFAVQVRDASFASATKTFALTVSAASTANIIWKADHETGNLSQWHGWQAGDGAIDSGNCTRPSSGVSSGVKRSGNYSMMMTIDTSSESGCRQFRNDEAFSGDPLYYSAWFYLPKSHAATNSWNIFQYKSKHSGASGSDPIWVIDLMPRSDGKMNLVLRFKCSSVKGPYSSSACSGSSSRYYQTLMTVPVGQWFHVETYLEQSSSYGGHITVWQDGVKLFDMANVITKYSDGDQRWSVNNYSDALTPNPATMYIDDAVIATERVGP
jgi:hypothetical protein